MSIIQSIKQLVGSGSGSESVGLYNCNDCSNLFTKSEGETDSGAALRCPNCESDNVEQAASS